MLRLLLLAGAAALTAAPAVSQTVIPVPSRPDVTYTLYDTHLSSNFVQTHVLSTDASGSQHEVWAFQCSGGWLSLLHREAGAPNRFPLPYPPFADEPLRPDTTIYTVALVSCQTHGFDTSGWGA